MNKICCFVVMMAYGLSVYAQTSEQQDLPLLNEEVQSEYVPVSQYWREHNVFQHLDASINLGTTGVGIELSSPMG